MQFFLYNISRWRIPWCYSSSGCSANRWDGDRFISLWLFSSFGRLFFKFTQCLCEGEWFITFVAHMIDKQFMMNLF